MGPSWTELVEEGLGSFPQATHGILADAVGDHCKAIAALYLLRILTNPLRCRVLCDRQTACIAMTAATFWMSCRGMIVIFTSRCANWPTILQPCSACIIYEKYSSSCSQLV